MLSYSADMDASVFSRNRPRVLLLFFLISWLLLGPGAWAEIPFHRRDQSDLLQLNEQNRFHVADLQDAVRYLRKYGYLKHCTMNGRNKRNIDLGPIIGGDENVQEGDYLENHKCTDEQIQTALKKLQVLLHLQPSGRLDSDTLQKMNARRCGNPDIDENSKDKTTQSSLVTSPGTTTTSATTVEPEASTIVEQTQQKSVKKRSVDDVMVNEQAIGDNPVLGQRLTNGADTEHDQSNGKNSRLVDLLMPKRTQENNFAENIMRDLNSNRRRLIQEFMSELKEQRAQAAKVDPNYEANFEKLRKMVHIRRVKRSDPLQPEGQVLTFNKADVKWRLLGIQYSEFIPADAQLAVLRLAFRMWSEVIPLRFTEDNQAHIRNLDIEIGFGIGKHMDCEQDFDGKGGEVAHSWSGGDIHIDDAENFSNDKTSGVNLLQVVLHEIGHVLTLNHSATIDSIMYPIYYSSIKFQDLELKEIDRRKVQQVYGVCKGRFDTVFDVLERMPTGMWLYFSYFFRGNRYWMYENRFNRTRYGDPLSVTHKWKGLPAGITAGAQAVFKNRVDSRIENNLFMFRGEDVFIFDVAQDRIKPGFPQKITSYFGPKKGSTESIPANVDTVYFDWRDENLYFFKGEWVWIYDITASPEERGCCEKKAKFIEVFPPAQGEQHILTGNVDAAYYSFKHNKHFFFKNETIYENESYVRYERVVRNSIKYIGHWYDWWYDICDV